MSRTLPLLRPTATRRQSVKHLGGRRSSVTFAPRDAFTEALIAEVPEPAPAPAAQSQPGQRQPQQRPPSAAHFQGGQQRGAASLQQPAQQGPQRPEPAGAADAAGGQGQPAAALGAYAGTKAASVEDSGAEGRRPAANSAQVAAVQADSAATSSMPLSRGSEQPSRAAPSMLVSEGFVGAEAGAQLLPLDTSTAGSGSNSLPPVAGVPTAASVPGPQSQAQNQEAGEQAAGPEETAAQQQTPEGHLEPELSGGAVETVAACAVHMGLPEAVMPFKNLSEPELSSNLAVGYGWVGC